MDEQKNGLPKSDPPTVDFWQQVWESVRDELRWLASTTGVIFLSLAIGRLIQRLTGGGSVDPALFNNSNWQQEVERKLKERERGDSEGDSGGSDD